MARNQLPLRRQRDPQVSIPLHPEDRRPPNVEIEHNRDEDPGSGGIEVAASAKAGKTELFGVDLRFLTDRIEGSIAELGRHVDKLGRLREVPTIQELHNSGTTNAAGFVQIDMGAPAASKTWDVRRVAVSGPDPNLAQVACQVRVFRVQSSPLHLVDVGLAIPVVDDYSRAQFNLKPEEHWFVAVTGFTASTFVGVAASAEETTWQRREEYAL